MESVIFGNGLPNVHYTYDANGNRLSKRRDDPDQTTTYYVRSPDGNILSVYTKANNVKKQKEVPIYGSSRVGQYNFDRTITGVNPLASVFDRQRGSKVFELSNHLGNVLATISDQKTGSPETGNDWAAEYYEASLFSAQDYYPFGLEIPNPNNVNNGYRYGFNGKENDRDGEFGSDLIQDYGFRMYNPRVGRFLSVDPIARDFPWNSVYAFAENRVIDGIDLDGLEVYLVHGTGGSKDAWDSDPELKMVIADKMGNQIIREPFEWDGNNNSADRKKAANRLVSYILSSRDKNGTEPITIVGHSHGGSVGILAVNELRKMEELDGVEINLVTLNTPHRDDYELDVNVSLDPNTEHYALFVFDDIVAHNNAGYDRTGKINESGVGPTTRSPGNPPDGTEKRVFLSFFLGKKFFKTDKGRRMGGESGSDVGDTQSKRGRHPNALNYGISGVNNFWKKIGLGRSPLNAKKNHRLWEKKYGQSEKAKEVIRNIEK